METTKPTETKKVYASERQLLGSLAKWATAQSPYHRPDNLEVVLDKFHAIIAPLIGKQYCLIFADARDLNKFLREKLDSIPEFLLWNERKNGNKAEYSFVTATSSPHPDNDFIDLDALTRNVVNEIIGEQLTQTL